MTRLEALGYAFLYAYVAFGFGYFTRKIIHANKKNPPS